MGGRACAACAHHPRNTCLGLAGNTSRIYARSRQHNTKVSDDGSKRKKYTAVSGQPVPAAAHFAAPVESMKQLLQHTPVPMPASKESMDSFNGVKVTNQMQQELEKGTQRDLAQVRAQRLSPIGWGGWVGSWTGCAAQGRGAVTSAARPGTQYSLQGCTPAAYC